MDMDGGLAEFRLVPLEREERYQVVGDDNARLFDVVCQKGKAMIEIKRPHQKTQRVSLEELICKLTGV